MKKIILFGGLLLGSLTAKSQYLIGFKKEIIMQNESRYKFQELSMKMNDTGAVISGTTELGAKIFYLFNKKGVSTSSIIMYGNDAIGASREVRMLDNNAIKQTKTSWLVTMPDNSKIYVEFGVNSTLGYNFTHVKYR